MIILCDKCSIYEKLIYPQKRYLILITLVICEVIYRYLLVFQFSCLLGIGYPV